MNPRRMRPGGDRRALLPVSIRIFDESTSPDNGPQWTFNPALRIPTLVGSR